MAINLFIDLTTLDDGGEVNWTPSNISDPGEDTIDPIEGTTCVGIQVGNETTTLTKAITSTDLTDTHLYVWVLSFVGPTLAAKSAGGIQIGVGDGTNEGHWYLGGNDNYAGGWKCFVVYTGKAYDREVNTLSALTAITELYMTFTNTVKAKTPNCFFDYIRYGNNPAIITGGTSGDPADFDQLASASVAQAIGTAQKEGAVITMRGPHRIGTGSATDTFFESVEELVVWDTQDIDSGTVDSDSFYRLDFEGNQTNTSSFILGSAIGSGLDTIGAQGTLITTPTQSVRWDLNFNTASFDVWKVYGSSFGNLRQVEFGRTDLLDEPEIEIVDTTFTRPHYVIKQMISGSLIKNWGINFASTGSVTASTLVLFDTGTIDGTQYTLIQGHGLSSVDDGVAATYTAQSINFATAEKFLDVKNNKTWNIVDPVWTLDTGSQRLILFEDSTGVVNEQISIITSTATAAGTSITGSSIYVYEGLTNQNLPTSGTTGAAGEYTDTVLKQVLTSGSDEINSTLYGNFAIKAYSYLYNPFVASYNFNTAYEQGITFTPDVNLTSTDSASAISAGSGITVTRDNPPNLLITYVSGSDAFVPGEIVTGEISTATGVVAQVVEGDATAGKLFLVTRNATPFQVDEGLAGSLVGAATSSDTGSSYTWHISGSNLTVPAIYDYMKAKTAEVNADPIFTASIEWGEAEQSLLLYGAGVGSVYTERNTALEEGVFLTKYGAGTVDYLTDDSGSTYTPPQQFTLTLAGIESGSEVRIYEIATGNELAGQEDVDNPPGTFQYSYTYTGSDIDVTVVIHNVHYIWQSLDLTLTNSDNTVPISQIFDRNYDNPASAGGAPTPVQFVASFNHEISSSTFYPTIPPATQEDDIILAYTAGRANAVFTVPTGSNAYSHSFLFNEGGNTGHQMWWRRAGAGEGGTTETWSTNNTARENEMAYVVVRGAPTAGDPFDVAWAKTSAYDDTPSCPAITVATSGSLLIHSWGKRVATLPTEDTGYPASSTGIMRRFYGNGGIGLAYRSVASGLTAAEDWATITGEANLQVEVTVAIKPGS